MAGAGNDAAGNQLWKLVSLVWIFRRWPRDAIVCAIQRDRRHIDFRTLSQAALHLLKAGVSGRVADSMTIRVNHQVHEVGIVERRRGAVKSLIGEMPSRGPVLPEEP